MKNMRDFSIIAIVFDNGNSEAHVIDTTEMFDETPFTESLDDYDEVWRIDFENGEPRDPYKVYEA